MQITFGTLLTIVFLSAAVYLWSLDLTDGMERHSPAEYGMLGQMIVSVSRVNLVEAGNYNLPWSGDTWLINLVVNPADAESVIARMGYFEDTIPGEEISADQKQAKYDLKIKFTPVAQECIYGPDMSTFDTRVPVRVQYKEFDLGTATLSCNHANDWQTAIVEPYKQQLLKTYDDVAWYCVYTCGADGLATKHAYLSCLFALFKEDPGVTGMAQMTLKSLYVKDRVSVTAGYKTATGETKDTIDVSSDNPTTVLYYGSQPVGKVDLVGYLKAKDYCPEGANYRLFSAGSGWKVVPEETWDNLMAYVRPLDIGAPNIPDCSNINDWSDYDRCRSAMQDYSNRANSLINAINNSAPTIDGKAATKPSAIEYSAAYYFAIKPDTPVVYSQYRMYLKADWVGILVSMAQPSVQSVSPTSLTLTGPETKQVSVVVRNDGDEGGVIVKVICSNNFLVDGKSESVRTATLQRGETRTFIYNISYGGDGRMAASTTCTVTAQASANPNISSRATFTALFKPKGIYPPNTTVCITNTTYARTDDAGNIVPGTERTCPEGTYCVDTSGAAKCEQQNVLPPDTGGTTTAPSTSDLRLIAAIVGGIVVLVLVLAVAL